MEVRLVVTNEKSNAKQVRLGPETVVGRSSECNLRIASGQVSRQHCIIRVEDTRVVVRDLGSANGTEIDGVTIPPEIDVPVEPGSTLAIGPLKFVFEFTPPPPAEPDVEDDLQSTTQDISPIPARPEPQIDEEDTKDYGPSLDRLHQSERENADEPGSGQLDFSEGQPTSPVAVVGGDRKISSEGSSLVSAEETVFDSELSDRERELAMRLAQEGRGFESGTELLLEGTGASTPGDPPQEASRSEDPPEDNPADEADERHPGTKASRKGWGVFEFLQRGRKTDSGKGERPAEAPQSAPSTGLTLPSVDPAVPPPAADDDSDLQDFFKTLKPS